MSVRCAVLQMTSGPDPAANRTSFESMVREAVSHGAVFVASPENSDLLGLAPQDKLALVVEDRDHPMKAQASLLAKELGIWLLLGSIAVKAPGGKAYNRSYLFSPQGDAVAVYDKIHLFDVTLPTGEVRRESQSIVAGSKAVLAKTDFGLIGMSVCYDVRFPYLYRTLAHQGAQILTVPAAFTVPTGEMHWKTLLRARAIENGAFVIAPAQCGDHGNGRKTYGHSLIIDPWGKILAEGGDHPGIIYADLDMAEVDRFRSSIPSLAHERVVD